MAKTIKIKLEGGIMPAKQHPDDAAFDLYVPEDVVLSYGRQTIDMKFALEIPRAYAATIQPRSGCSSKGMEVIYRYVDEHGYPVRVEKYRLDADVVRGLVDSGYRGHVHIILKVNEIPFMPDTKWILKKGSRIAQMQIVRVPDVVLLQSEHLAPSERDVNGFGSTGVR